LSVSGAGFVASPRTVSEGSKWIRRFSHYAAICSGAAGLLVLIGWAQDIDALKRVHSGLTSMNPLSACCFVLSSIAIMSHLEGRSRLALALGTLIAFLASLKMLDLTLISVPVDRLLFADSLLGEPGSRPSRMAPNTAVAFLLVGLSLAFSAVGGRWRALVSQVLASAVLLISMFALIGYGFGMGHLNQLGPFIPMAIHTGMMLLILSLGLVTLRQDEGIMLVLRDRGAAGSMARSILPLALLISVAVGALRLWGQEQGYYGTEAGVALQVIANVLVTSVLLISSIVALYRSDSVRRRREQALARSEAQYRLAETVANVGHWRIDLPSFEVQWSDELFRICGRAKGKGPPSTRDMLKLYHPDDRSTVRDSVKAALRDGRDWQYRVRLRRPNGELRHVSSQGVCERDTDGNLTSIFGVFADVTDLEHARREAEAATAAKAAFLANMSHEIRTPLNGVMGFAELLLSAELDPQQKRHATLILDSAQALLKLLNDILDVSKIEAGQLEVAAEPFDLPHQLHQCVRLMDTTAQKKGLELSLSIDPGLPRYVVGDGLRVRQVILNLLGNALKFTERGFVAVDAMLIQSASGAAEMRISVADTGVGIPEARQQSVFEAFVQADATTSRRFGGSGLGLSISRRLVALMGGKIELKSQEGVGTRVSVTLPLQEAKHVPATSSASTEGVAPQVPDQGEECRIPRILLVEDLDINQELITGMLGRMGYQVETASDGAEAIAMAEKLSSEPLRYDLILMDVQMPVVDGLTATRAIRDLQGRASRIPIVALTANAYASEIEDCRKAGMNDHLSKPVSMAALGRMLTHWLPGKRPIQPPAPMPAEADSAASKFGKRIYEYAARLEEIKRALDTATNDTRASLLSEAQSMAHNLSGTAAMFGRAALGELAAEVEDQLDAIIDGIDAPAEDQVQRLMNALRHAA
jgi:PAS domain S-box-containing protein